MKKLLIFPILFVCFLSNAQALDSASIIGKSFKLGNLIVAQNDFPNQMNWDAAKKACAALGNGWRLPTQYELEILNKNKSIISGFTNGSYWSSDDRVFLFAWQKVFLFDDQSNTGYLPSASTGWGMKHTPNHVRAIRGPELQEDLSNMSFTSLIEHLSKYLFFGFLIFVVIITTYMKMNPSAPHNPNSFLNRTLNWIKGIGK